MNLLGQVAGLARLTLIPKPCLKKFISQTESTSVLPTNGRLNIMYSRIGEKFGLTILDFVNAQSIIHIVLQLHDVLRFDSAVVINVLINTSSPKLNNQIF